MSEEFKPYTPTDEEAEAIDRAGLSAAWLALQPLKDDKTTHQQMVLACLRAFNAARKAWHKASADLLAKHPEVTVISHYPEETDMVCSAMIALELDSPAEIYPRSVGGARLSALLQSAKVLEAMSSIHAVLDDSDDAVFGSYLAEEATMLAEASINGTRPVDR